MSTLLDVLLLVTGLAPFLETNLPAEPCETLYATDASPSGAGGCFASTTREDWLALYDLDEEKAEHVRLDWKGEEAPSNMHDVRVAASPLALRLKWTTLFSYSFFADKHINLLELESWISLLRRVTREGVQAGCQSSHLLRPQSSHQPMPSRSWICSVNRCRLRPMWRASMCAYSNLRVPSVVRE